MTKYAIKWKELIFSQRTHQPEVKCYICFSWLFLETPAPGPQTQAVYFQFGTNYLLPATAPECPGKSYSEPGMCWAGNKYSENWNKLIFFSCLLPAIFRVLPFLEISYKYTPTVGSIFCVKLLSKFFLPIFCYPFCVSTCPIIFTSRKWEQGHRKDQEMLEIRVKSPLLTLSKSLFWIYFPSRSMMFIILHPFFSP